MAEDPDSDNFMRLHPSPFRPGYGERPEVLVGRDDLLRSIHRGLLTSTSHQLALYGPRGTGKTVLLRDLEDWANDRDWLTVSHQIAPGQPTGRLIIDKLREAAGELPGSWRHRLHQGLDELTGVTVAGVGVTRRDEPTDRPLLTLERALIRAGRLADDADRGVLLLVDEIQAIAPGDEVVALTQAFQAVKGRHPVHVIVAGLHTPDLRGTRGATYFERIAQDQVGLLDASATRDGLLQPISQRNVPMHADALEVLAERAGGYPFFIQLFGHHTWEAWVAAGAGGPITSAHAASGLARSAPLVDSLLGVRWGRLGHQAQRFLTAMAQEGATSSDPVSLSAVARRLERSANSLSQTRDTLIGRHQLVTDAGRGQLQFSIPVLNRWLITHAEPAGPWDTDLPTPDDPPATDHGLDF